jgi:hypothetical protein
LERKKTTIMLLNEWAVSRAIVADWGRNISMERRCSACKLWVAPEAALLGPFFSSNISS